MIIDDSWRLDERSFIFHISQVNSVILYGVESGSNMGLDATKPVFCFFLKKRGQTCLLSYTDYLEIWNFAFSKPRYDTYQKTNNKGADQTAPMRRLVCACVVCKPQKTGFLVSRPILRHVLE